MDDKSKFGGASKSGDDSQPGNGRFGGSLGGRTSDSEQPNSPPGAEGRLQPGASGGQRHEDPPAGGIGGRIGGVGGQAPSQPSAPGGGSLPGRPGLPRQPQQGSGCFGTLLVLGTLVLFALVGG